MVAVGSGFVKRIVGYSQACHAGKDLWELINKGPAGDGIIREIDMTEGRREDGQFGFGRWIKTRSDGVVPEMETLQPVQLGQSSESPK